MLLKFHGYIVSLIYPYKIQTMQNWGIWHLFHSAYCAASNHILTQVMLVRIYRFGFDFLLAHMCIIATADYALSMLCVNCHMMMN